MDKLALNQQAHNLPPHNKTQSLQSRWRAATPDVLSNYCGLKSMKTCSDGSSDERNFGRHIRRKRGGSLRCDCPRILALKIYESPIMTH